MRAIQIVLAAGASVMCAPAFAQLEEIVVTAQKRSENLQDVPIAISALTSNDLVARGFTEPADLSAVVPGFQFSMEGANGAPYIRGVGSLLGNPTDESSVATYIDGIYLASPTANFADFNTLDLERVEVLKGPQGTLFGRNATGGVIQLITRDPSNTAALEANVGYGRFDTVSSELYANTPITDKIAFNVAADYHDQGTGWGHNVLTGADTYKDRAFSVRSKLQMRPDDATVITLAADISRYNSVGLDYQHLPVAPFIDGVPDTIGPYNIRYDGEQLFGNDSYGASLHIQRDLDAVRLENITAYRWANAVNNFDYDQTPLPIVGVFTASSQRNLSEEIHLLSPTGAKLQWMAGYFFFDGRGGDSPFSETGTAVAPFARLNIKGLVKDRSSSLFGQATAEIFAATRLTLGLRYTWERQEMDQLYYSNLGLLGSPYNPRQSFGKATWRAALEHTFAPGILGYISDNRGIKSGGFNILAPSGAPGYHPEILDAYEIGLKTEFLDKRVRLNSSAFWYQYRDLQVSDVVNAQETTNNAAKARIRGFDVDAQFAATDALSLSLTAGYLDARYQAFPGAIGFPLSGGTVVFDATGRRMIHAPLFSGSLTVDYRFTTAVGALTASVTGTYSGRYYEGPDDRLYQPGYGLLNASLLWQDPSARYNIRVWGKNLTNKLYFAQATESGLTDSILYASPRTYGVTLGVRF
jgi:iron complex outermembrane recepter protein